MSNKYPEDLLAIVVFYNKSQGFSQRLAFSDEFRHCNCITYDGRDWIMTEFLPSGMLNRVIHCAEGAKLVEKLRIIPEAIIALSIDPRKGVRWSPWWTRSCNEVCRYTTGAATGWTLNPAHLYKKLLKYDQRRNWIVLSHWRLKDGRERRLQRSVGTAEPSGNGGNRAEETVPIPDTSGHNQRSGSAELDTQTDTVT